MAGDAPRAGNDVGERALQQAGDEPAGPQAPPRVRSPRAGLPRAELRQERARGPDLEADRPRPQAAAVQARRSFLSGGLRPPRDGGAEPGLGRAGVDAQAQRARQPRRLVPPHFYCSPLTLTLSPGGRGDAQSRNSSWAVSSLIGITATGRSLMSK